MNRHPKVELLASELVLVDSTPVVDVLADPQFDLTAIATSEPHRAAVSLMHKSGNLVSTVGVDRRDLAWLFSPTEGASPLNSTRVFR